MSCLSREARRSGSPRYRAHYEIAEAVHAIREGDYVGAARGLDGASGPLARKQVDGSVTTVIEKAGPEARARTSVNGNLLQEVRTQNGPQMRKAE